MEEKGAQAWLHAGDFYNWLDARRIQLGRSDHEHKNDIPALTSWLGARAIPVYSVAGNHDVADPANGRLKTDISGDLVEVSPGLWVVGLGWCGERFDELPLERDMREVCKAVIDKCMSKMKNGDSSIILTHYPANLPELWMFDGGNPEGWMFGCIRTVIDAIKPLAVIQGHLHGLFGHAGEYEGSLVVYPGPKGGYLDVDTVNGTAKFEFRGK